jgi:hypothetical protein
MTYRERGLNRCGRRDQLTPEETRLLDAAIRRHGLAKRVTRSLTEIMAELNRLRGKSA